jgi:hypothetical protein
MFETPKAFRREEMKRLLCIMLLSVICLPVDRSLAQEKTPEKSKNDERAKPGIPIKVQIVVAEYDGEKKTSSMPYSFLSLADEKFWGTYNTSLRTGVRIPIEVDGKDQKTTYMDVGLNIDCGIKTEDDGRYFARLTLERTSLYPGGSSGEEQLGVSRPHGQPIIHQFKISENHIFKDGQTLEMVSSTNPLNGHVLRISVTINVMK